MTNLRKGIEALVLGILCSVLIGGFVTMNIEQALDGNLHESGASNIILDVKDRAIYTSYLFVGNLFPPYHVSPSFRLINLVWLAPLAGVCAP